MGVGELSNFVLGAIFVGVAGIIYKKIHSRKGALIGTLVGALTMAVISVATNYFIVYPAYVVIYGIDGEGNSGESYISNATTDEGFAVRTLDINCKWVFSVTYNASEEKLSIYNYKKRCYNCK
mgnify:CR=1 FL=1